MSEIIKGKLEIQNSNGSGTAVSLNGNALPQSGLGKDIQGELSNNPQQTEPSFITGQLDLKDQNGNVVMSFSLGRATIGQSPGVIELMGLSGGSNLHLSGNGIISITGAGQLQLGEKPQGLLANTNPPIVLNAVERSMTFTNAVGATMSLTASNQGGEIRIPGGLHAINATLRLGAEADGKGGNGVLFLCNSDGKPTLTLKAETSEAIFRNPNGKETMRLDGKTGDIVLHNADCAEEFEAADGENVEPGSVMILDDNGRLQQAYQAYDKRVAGVISGAGDYKPGIILDKQPHLKNRWPLALMGKVYCKADAQFGAIAPGDMLTTSPTLGHVMKVGDPLAGFGAVIGKALRPLQTGKGLIPVLVTLQ